MTRWSSTLKKTVGQASPWPRGNKASKQDLQHETSSMALENTLKAMMTDKEEASAKESKKRKKE
jgi:hypothetical protein